MIILVMWATELDTSLSSSISQPSSIDNRPRETVLDMDQFSYVGNRARYRFIELDISTGLDEQIDLGKPVLDMPNYGGQPSSVHVYRRRYLDRLR